MARVSLAKSCIVLVEQRAGEHVGTGERELERAARDARRACAVFGQVQGRLR